MDVFESLKEKIRIDVPKWKAATEIVPDDWNSIDDTIAAEQRVAMQYLKQALK